MRCEHIDSRRELGDTCQVVVVEKQERQPLGEHREIGDPCQVDVTFRIDRVHRLHEDLPVTWMVPRVTVR